MLPQQKGHDNSGFAMVMQDLGGVFQPYKDKPLLSYAALNGGVDKVRQYMQHQGWDLLLEWSPQKHPQAGLDIALLEHYNFEVYDFPESYQNADKQTKENLLTDTRLALRALTEARDEAFIYSFWPDVLTLKEIGNPRDIGTYFGLWDEDAELRAKIITTQCRQNTNYAIVRYAAHPFFLQGYTVLANGENTFYIKNKEFQKSLNRGYLGFESDSQCFLYTLHYLQRELQWPLAYYKHVITPLPFEELMRRPDRDVLLALRQSLPHLEINGPNTIIGVLPDGRVLNVNDSKKLRPVVIGGDGETVAVSSEVCGLNVLLPERDQQKDIYPHEREMIVINNDLEVARWKQ
jgi:glutamate synthase domain-containing protein 1